MYLKLCPFCGGECYIVFNETVGDYKNPTPFTPICSDCGCDLGGFETRELAIKAWNKRYEPRMPNGAYVPAGNTRLK